jgi:luciferase family oxidoreductase group 1
MTLPPLSVLELVLIETGHSQAEGLAAATEVARRVDELGYRRFWVAEHHGSPSIGSAAPPVLATHLAGLTTHMRIGSGGMLLPNHAPVVIAEQFATLAALHPGRIDLGVGRGPGTFNPAMVRALRRGGEPSTDAEYQGDLVELLALLSRQHDLRIAPGPGPGDLPQPWLLSSSDAGAALAAEHGLPIAFAHHIRPANTLDALRLYRNNFQPSRWQDRPYAIISVEALAAETAAEAEAHGRPMELIREGLVSQRGDVELPSPADAAQHVFDPAVAEQLELMRSFRAQGTPETVVATLAALAEQTEADELMLVTGLYEPAARIRSFELIAEAARVHGERSAQRTSS